MAEIPCPNKVDCEGSDFPITNYSAEGAEQVPTFNSLVFPSRWDKFGCLSLCVSEVSQNDADLCALAQEAACHPTDPDGDTTFCSTEQTCSCVNANGNEAFFITPAGTFCADTQEGADAQAQAYACIHCGSLDTSVLLGNLDACTCLGSTYSEQIQFTGNTPTSWFITSGDLPDGLSMNSDTGRITGTTEAAGTFVFTVRANLSSGNWSTKTYSITVLVITTSALPNYSLGVAYSKQMEASGGSGNYRWEILSGELPTGMTMSTSGLISGTPTASDGVDPLLFGVIDTTCEALNRTNVRPRVSVTTNSTSILRSYKGYPEYETDAGTLYKKITFTGQIEQTATTAPSQVFPVTQCAGASYVYSGSSEIDANGNYISRHRKDLMVACPLVTAWPAVAEGPNALAALTIPGIYWSESRIHRLLGYCFPYDFTNSPCPTCDFDSTAWTSYGDYQTASPLDPPADMLTDPAGFTTTPTTFAYSGTVTGPFETDANIQVVTFDSAINISATGSYGATLSEPYTEADAIASQQTISGTSATAENRPDFTTNTIGFLSYRYSRFSSVAFMILCSNLINGERYSVTYDLWQNNGSVTTIQTDFEATGDTHEITGTIATPATSGTSITLKTVRIGYAN